MVRTYAFGFMSQVGGQLDRAKMMADLSAMQERLLAEGHVRLRVSAHVPSNVHAQTRTESFAVVCRAASRPALPMAHTPPRRGIPSRLARAQENVQATMDAHVAATLPPRGGGKRSSTYIEFEVTQTHLPEVVETLLLRVAEPGLELLSGARSVQMLAFEDIARFRRMQGGAGIVLTVGEDDVRASRQQPSRIHPSHAADCFSVL
eukprot:SAG11_NODE_411_length_9696_cov_46.841513_5_plen_205_part_00